jgi:hypothetical protein
MIGEYIIQYKIHNDMYRKNEISLKQGNITNANIKKIYQGTKLDPTRKGPTIFSFNPLKWFKSPVGTNHEQVDYMAGIFSGGKRRKAAHKRTKKRRITRRR